MGLEIPFIRSSSGVESIDSLETDDRICLPDEMTSGNILVLVLADCYIH